MASTIFISAGEASGEAYGALLIDALKSRLAAQGQEARFFGMGGPRMAAAGLLRIVRAEDVAVMGITEVLRHLPRILREFGRLKRSIRRRKPQIAILIDFPDIHFALAKELHRQGIPVLYFVSPQLWAWKKHRIKLVQRYVDRMLVIFPFEEPFYRERGIDAEFVGHPLAELPVPTISREEFAGQNQLDPSRTWIGLLPGSRMPEIRALLPEMLKAARALTGLPSVNPDSSPNYSGQIEVVLPLAPTLNPAQRDAVRRLAAAHDAGLTLRFVDDSRAALHHARASFVASGTATVEAALIGNPFVVVYRVSPLTYAIAKRVVKVPHVAMVNLVAGKRVIPELIQNDFTASNIVREIMPLLPDGTPRQSMMLELAKIRGRLHATSPPGADHAGAIARVAEIALGLLGAAATEAVAETVPR
jgi:lipid-A-disaccharide synthase